MSTRTLELSDQLHDYLISVSVPPDELWERLSVETHATVGFNMQISPEQGQFIVLLLKLAPALDTLDKLLADGKADSFDFAFIDADKSNYVNYYEKCLQLVRPGGLVSVDNTLWGGSVANPAKDDPDTVAIRLLNEPIFSDARVESSLVPIGDGLHLAFKKHL